MITLLEKALFEFVLVLERLNIDYVIIGAIATGLYATPRTTYDIDFIIAIEKVKLCLFLDELKKNEFGFDKDHVLEELKEGYLSEVYYQGVRIDILLPALPYFKQIINKAVTFNLSGKELKFASAEDLVILKLLSNRERDREDIKTIKEIHAGLNITYIKDSLKNLVGESHQSFVVFQEMFEEEV